MAAHNIGIIGAGPVGSIMAAYLARNGENVVLVDIKKEIISARKSIMESCSEILNGMWRRGESSRRTRLISGAILNGGRAS
ncbi:MAG: 3-hydroxyacyl-CoA dehydrogenase NAD-binding domain-containing protein [Candidatus Aminicenantes bacterium]|nr:3-hydroxyacyl-CoA dehydrogenase NAD-binding domain-containing protein [Candidatus Aminicenantes bacterium]MDH5706031.1 3-hydroxyacyl-CoA dehydrogenase NAD-binding domain-containing protein [Candidatus Aminicenantes bacterium]